MPIKIKEIELDPTMSSFIDDILGGLELKKDQECTPTPTFQNFHSYFLGSRSISLIRRESCPEIGRYLTELDIGEIIVRVSPVELPLGILDWSFVAERDFVSLPEIDQQILSSIIEDRIELKLPHLGKILLERAYSNDGKWCTLKEFKNYISQHPKAEQEEKAPSPPKLLEKSRLSPPNAVFKAKKIKRECCHFKQKSTDQNFEDKLSFSDLFHQVQSSIPLPLKNDSSPTLDYAFHPPVNDDFRASEDQERIPNPASSDPYQILGLAPEERNFPFVEKRYKRLALIYHPDRGGSTEIFQKISNAYEEIKFKLCDPLFVFSDNSVLETKVQEARLYVSQRLGFKEVVFLKSALEKEVIVTEHFISELAKVQFEKSDQEEIQFHFNDLKKEAEAYLNFNRTKYLIIAVMETAEQTLADRSIPLEEKILLCSSKIQEIKSIEFSKKQWGRENIKKLFNNIQHSILDKYLALERARLKLLSKQELPEEEIADQIRDLLIEKNKFLNDFKRKVQREFKIIQDNEMLFREDVKKYRVQTERKTSSENDFSQTNSSSNSSNSSNFANSIDSFKPPSFTLEMETDELKNNILKNYIFFNLIDPLNKNFTI